MMTAVRVSPRDKRPFPTVDGLCKPDLAGICFEDPCYSALPLPIPGQIGYLDTEALALIEQTGLPTFADAVKHQPPQCGRAEPANFFWALRDSSSASPDAGVPRLRALLIVQCGMAEGREGSYPETVPQLLVYGADGRLEVVADMRRAAVLDWEKGSDGPKLTRAAISGTSRSDDRDIEAATAVVATK